MRFLESMHGCTGTHIWQKLSNCLPFNMPLIYCDSENCLDLILNILLDGIWLHKFEKLEKDRKGLSEGERERQNHVAQRDGPRLSGLWPGARTSFKWRVGGSGHILFI